MKIQNQVNASVFDINDRYVKQDQQASRVEPQDPKLSRVLSRVKFRLSVPVLLLLLLLVLDCDNTR